MKKALNVIWQFCSYMFWTRDRYLRDEEGREYESMNSMLEIIG